MEIFPPVAFNLMETFPSSFGGCRFVVMLASDHSAIVGRVAYLGRPPHFRRLVDVFHRIKKSLPPVENAVHTPPAGYQPTFN